MKTRCRACHCLGDKWRGFCFLCWSKIDPLDRQTIQQLDMEADDCPNAANCLNELLLTWEQILQLDRLADRRLLLCNPMPKGRMP